MGLFSKKEQEEFVINPHEKGKKTMYFVVLYCKVKGFEKSLYLQKLRENNELSLNYEKVIYQEVEKIKLTVSSASERAVQSVSDTAGLHFHDVGMKPVY